MRAIASRNPDTTATQPVIAAIAHVCAIAVAAYFLYAAFDKILNPRQFAVDIKNYRILPEALVNLPALFMPWLEAFSAIALIAPKTRRAGAIVISGLLVMFIGMVGYSAIYMGYDISCGCTGKNSAPAGWLTIGRNCLLLLGTASSLYLPAWIGRSRRSTFPFDTSVEAATIGQPAYAVSNDQTAPRSNRPRKTLSADSPTGR